MSSLTNFERTLLSAVLDGDSDVLEVLRSQTEFLKALNRTHDETRYLVEFSEVEEGVPLLEEPYSGMIIHDTFVVLEHDDTVLHVELIILFGACRYLSAGSKERFDVPSKVSDRFWKYPVSVEPLQWIEVRDSKKRDFKKAFGFYLPEK